MAVAIRQVWNRSQCYVLSTRHLGDSFVRGTRTESSSGARELLASLVTLGSVKDLVIAGLAMSGGREEAAVVAAGCTLLAGGT